MLLTICFLEDPDRFFLHTSIIKIENSGILVMVDKSILHRWLGLLIQDKKSTRINSIVSIPKQLLAAIMFNKTRLNWCEFIAYNLDSRSFSTKNKSKLHLF